VNVPRWFYAVLASCAIAWTITHIVDSRQSYWELKGEDVIFKPSTGEFCTATNDVRQVVCVDLKNASRRFELMVTYHPTRNRVTSASSLDSDYQVIAREMADSIRRSDRMQRDLDSIRGATRK
jgi:hypothetical protein